MKFFIQLILCFALTFSIASCDSFCDIEDCGPNGTCNPDTEQCDCDDFFEGDNCELEIREIFLGVWTATSVDNPAAQTFEVGITEGLTVDAVQIQTPGLLQNFTITGMLDANNNIDIPDFLTNISSNVYSGSLKKIDATTIELTLTGVVTNGNSATGVYTLTK